MADCTTCITQGTPLWDLFSQEDNCEHNLFQSLIEEFVNIAGYPIQYHMSIVNMDTLFGEDGRTDYYEPLPSKLIYEPTEESAIIESFGFRGDDVLQYAMIPKIKFIKDIGTSFQTLHPSADIIQPLVGDVITTLWNNRNYEIVDVGSEERIFMGKKHIWEMILRPFRFSSESERASEIHMEGNIDELEIIEDEMDETITEKPYPSVKYGDNTWIEEESDDIDSYGDVDETIFGL